MIVTIDVGNSTILLGGFEGGEPIGHLRLSTRSERTPDEHRVLLDALRRQLEGEGADGGADAPGEVTGICLGSVVPAVTDSIAEAVHAVFGKEPFIATPNTVPWVPIQTDNRSELGPDLMANAVAGYDACGNACVVFDFGTALSCTVVNDDGAVVGVSILPGLRGAVRSLAQMTARLPEVALQAPPRPFGTDTTSAIQSGIVYGYASLVTGLVDRYEHELGTQVQPIATGGLAGVVAPLVDRFSVLDPWLTLRGLASIYSRSQQDG